MKPLQAIGLGLIIVVLQARFAALQGWDAYYDPLGWLLVMYGVHRLPTELEHHPAVMVLGWLAALASVPLSVPAVESRLESADPSLAWVSNLPKFGFVLLLCLALAEAATERSATSWLRTVATVCAFVAVAPVLVFGAGWDALASPTGLAAQLVLLWVIWLLFTYSGRTWAGAPSPEPRGG